MRRPVRHAVVLTLAAVLVASCGTRSSDRSASAPAAAGSTEPAAAVNVPPGGPGVTAAPAASDAASQPAAPGSGQSTSGAVHRGSTSKDPARPPTAAAAQPAASAQSSGAVPGVPAPPGAPGSKAPEPTPAAPTKKSPVVIASVGTISGPLGGVFVPGTLAVQTWTSYINTKGGVNGHPVQLLVYDDGGDPARHRSQVQEAIERRHVVAFVYNPEAVGGKPSQDYVTSKRVPVMGDEGGSPWFYDSPMYFAPISTGRPLWASSIYAPAKLLLPEGKKKLASVVCVEAQTCNEYNDVITKAAASAGFEHVFKGRSGVAQPDYSAECLSARNAGADVFLVVLDTASVGRLALACDRQGYHPAYSIITVIAQDRMKDDQLLEGLVAGTSAFPYFETGTPATDEYQEVMRTIGTKVPRGVASATGWVAAKLFEKAAANMPEPPTAEAVLRGLWSLRNDTLGGLTSTPLTFTEGQNAPPLMCWYTIRIQNKQWVSTDGFKPQCRADDAAIR